MAMIDRRVRRSSTRQVALTHFLEEARQRLGAEAMALSSPEGLFIAGSGRGDLEELGATGSSGQGAWNGLRLHTFSITALDETLTLSAVGARPRPGELDAGVARILEAPPPAP